MMKGQVLYANFLRRGWEGTEKEEWLSLPITMRLDIMSHIPVLEWTPEDDGKLLAQTI